MLGSGHTVDEDDVSVSSPSASSTSNDDDDDDDKELLRKSLENLVVYCIPIIEGIKQDISNLSAEVHALKQISKKDEATSQEYVQEFEELSLTEPVKPIEPEKKKRQKKKKLQILQSFKCGTLRLMKFFKDPFSTDEAKELSSPKNPVYGLSSPHNPLFSSHAIFRKNNESDDDQQEILKLKTESIDISKNKMYAVLELLQKSKQRHVKHRNTRSSCRQRSSESSSTQLEEWWDSPFEHEPRIPLAGKDMWAEKLSLTKR